ncbi:MAG: hypothetical protein ACKVX7_06880 [Planctomycetota bacterium]
MSRCRCWLVVLGCAAILTGAVGPPSFIPPRLGKKELSAHVDEFVAGNASVERCAELARALRANNGKPLASLVLAAVKNPATCARALALAADVPIVGATKELKKLVDSEHEAKVIAAILNSGDKEAESFVIDRWSRATPATPSYAALCTALQEYPLSAKAVGELHSSLKKPAKGVDRSTELRAVLGAQMGLSAAELERLNSDWKDLLAQFTLKTQTFPSAGHDLLRDASWERGMGDEKAADRVRRFREKFLLEPGGILRLPGITMQDFILKVWMLPLEGDGATVSVLMKGNSGVGPRLADGKWQSTAESIRQAIPPAAHGQWAEVVFSLAGSNLAVAVNGTTIMQTNLYGSSCNGIHVASGDKGRMLLGGVDLTQ